MYSNSNLGLEGLASALGGEAKADQILCPGPGHSARDRSLSVKLDATAADGFLVHSFAGDDPLVCRDYVRSRTGLPAFRRDGNSRSPVVDIERAVMAAAKGKAAGANRKIVATYDYADADGKLLYQVVRYEPKAFRQRRPDGNGGWTWSLGARRVLYRLPELLQFPSATVFVCEGEKDADRVASLDHCATTVASGKWTNECVDALAGRDIFILQDNDAAGQKKADEAARLLQPVAKSVAIVLLPDLPVGGDVSDWLDGGPHRGERLVDICMAAPPWTPDAAKGADRPTAKAAARIATPEFVCIAGVEAAPIEWLWPGRLARGKLTIIAGDPGLGKSQIGTDIAARISSGARWPDDGTAPLGRVIILSAEDGIADTLRPRLEVAGADLARVHVLTAMSGPDGAQRTFNLQADLSALAASIAAFGDVRLVMIDPITAYMGLVDSHRTTDVRAVLDPLARFAETSGVAVLAITHPPKASQAKAIHAFTGSLAFVAAARMAFIVIEEEDTARILLLHAKNNLAAPPEGLAFHKVQGVTANGIIASYISWDRAPVTISAGEAMHAAAQASRTGSALNDAKDFLRDALASGATAAESIKHAAAAEGISGQTLRRAREKLKVVVEKAGFDGPWTWRLP